VFFALLCLSCSLPAIANQSLSIIRYSWPDGLSPPQCPNCSVPKIGNYSNPIPEYIPYEIVWDEDDRADFGCQFGVHRLWWECWEQQQFSRQPCECLVQYVTPGNYSSDVIRRRCDPIEDYDAFMEKYKSLFTSMGGCVLS
jgi:hypothetical protein